MFVLPQRLPFYNFPFQEGVRSSVAMGGEVLEREGRLTEGVVDSGGVFASDDVTVAVVEVVWEVEGVPIHGAK